MMTTTEIKAVITAFEEGKIIEVRRKSNVCNDHWKVTEKPHWNFDNFDYRVKPEIKYVPYDDISEIQRDKWLKEKGCMILDRIVSINVRHQEVCIAHNLVDLTQLFEDYEYEDGTPCGKPVEK